MLDLSPKQKVVDVQIASPATFSMVSRSGEFITEFLNLHAPKFYEACNCGQCCNTPAGSVVNLTVTFTLQSGQYSGTFVADSAAPTLILQCTLHTSKLAHNTDFF
jgi:hypothetical protein